VKEIPLTRGYVAFVDDADFDWLSQFKWSVRTDRNHGNREHTYAKTGIWDTKNKSTRIFYMHHMIMGSKKEVDHADGDGLNNQRHNLRHATRGQNIHNSKLRLTKKSDSEKGVYKHKDQNKWMARITKNDKQIYLGLFEDKSKARKAYLEAARAIFGKFAR